MLSCRSICDLRRSDTVNPNVETAELSFGIDQRSHNTHTLAAAETHASDLANAGSIRIRSFYIYGHEVQNRCSFKNEPRVIQNWKYTMKNILV